MSELEKLKSENQRLISIIEKLSRLEKCDFDVESESDCDFCKTPSGLVFASVSYIDTPEANFYVCENCLPSRIQYELEDAATAQLRAENAELRAKLGGEWIPVDDERKPEEDQAIWVTVKREGFNHYVYRTIFSERFGRYVTAWKPRQIDVKPEPYKPEANK